MSREYSKERREGQGGRAGWPSGDWEAVTGRRKHTVVCHLGGEIEPLLQLQTAIPADSEEDFSGISVQRQTWLRKAAGAPVPGGVESGWVRS